jgi:hypothetical protein
MVTDFDPFAEDTSAEQTPAGPERKACPECGKEVTWTKGANSRPRQHKCEPKAATAEQQAPAAGGAADPMFPKVVQAYVQTRDEIAEINATMKEQVAGLNALQTKRENWLHGQLNAMGSESQKTAFGTAFIKSGDSATVAEREVFLEFMISTALGDALTQLGKQIPAEGYDALVAALAQSGAWNFLTNAIAKKEVKNFIEGGNPAPPPGVNYTTFQTVQVSRPRK